MKKYFKYALLFVAACTISFSLVACGDDKNDSNPTPTPEIPTDETAADIDYSSAYAEQWANYMVTVSGLLKDDAQTLYDEWNDGYADIFKNHNTSEYKSAIECVEQIFDGCIDIAGEVGDTKIGDPYQKYVAGNTTEALYAVESWYSWHSRDDYRNNIYSIRNAYYGSRDGNINANSLSALLAAKDADLDAQAKTLIKAAADAIYAIPQPFRNNINSKETVAAMDACADLGDFIEKELKPYFDENINDDATLDPVIKQYVDAVVLPTYKELAEKNAALDTAVRAFKSNPSNSAFTACANAWLSAREPWESSEAFLFGPVDELGLDPNMDSWPLDQAQIAEILKSQNFTNLNWNDGDADDKVEAAQNLRGFHTLEFLIFKDGKARTVK
ncbi:MAG: peptidase M75 [Paludibacteraceae bacterium]|nr:peptidase M75 [Paludibacteraceae bacterium]MBQ8715550.1 peptidase M75 [Prevotella sp.]